MVRAFRKNYIIFFFCMFVVMPTTAGNDEEFFLRGNKQYTQHNYDEAFKSYDMISKKSSAVLYNMGNSCFKKGDYAQALIYWSRAEIGATPQEYRKILHNKEYVASLIGKVDTSSLQYRMFVVLYSLLPYLSLFFLQLLFLLCWCLFIFLIAKTRIRFKKMILSCVSIIIIMCGALLQVHHARQGMQEGIIVKKDAQLLVGPDKGFQKLCPLVYAHNVAVKEIREGWYKIQYADMIGWVEAEIVQII